MTNVDVLFAYGSHPSEATMLALGDAREVYGIRRILVDPAARTVRVEYDATRLTVPVIRGLLRRAGLDVTAELPLAPVPPAPPEEPAPPALA